MVRNALAMMRLLNRVTRDDPDAPRRRAEQRAHGQTRWELRDGLVSEDLRGVLPPADAVLADYNVPSRWMPATTTTRPRCPRGSWCCGWGEATYRVSRFVRA